MAFWTKLLHRVRTWGARSFSHAPASALVDYRTLVDNSLDVICQVRVCAGHATFLYVSPSSLAVLGWTSDEMQRLQLHDLFPPDSLTAIKADIVKLTSGEPTSLVTIQATHRNGRVLWLENRVRLLANDGSGSTHFVVCMRDTTERKLLQDQLADLVLVDALTGVGNRRAFDAAIERELLAAGEFGRPLSLVMVDVDHFKRVNDRYGHQVGDECLRAIADATRRLMETPEAFVTRYGGEELAVLMPGTATETAVNMASELCKAVQSLRTRAAEPITVSCGVSTAPPRVRGTAEMARQLVAAADLALYEAKRQGRNQVLAREFGFSAAV